MPDQHTRLSALRDLLDVNEWKRQADLELERSILAARDAGLTHREIADALGITRQAVGLYLAHRQPKPNSKPKPKTTSKANPRPVLTDSELDTRIRDIERKWETLVAFYAEQWGDVDSDRRQQAILNRQSAAKKTRRRTKLSVKGSRLAYAETELLKLCHDQRDSVPEFALALNQLTILEELIQERNRRNDLKF